MASVVVYDSIYGNTEQIARAIGRGLAGSGEVQVLPVQQAKDLDLSSVTLLVLGSPTRGFQPTPNITEFAAGVTPPSAGLRAAAFDTRLDPEDIHPAPLRWVVNAGGYAAERIAAALTRQGWQVRGPNGDFVVGGTEGPLKPGELERAEAWGRALVSS